MADLTEEETSKGRAGYDEEVKAIAAIIRTLH